MTPYMGEVHKLELNTFALEVVIDGEGDAELIFYRDAKVVFRTSADELRTALTFAEKHGEITLVPR